MSKLLMLAAVAVLPLASGCAAPQPRYAIVGDPLAAAEAAPPAAAPAEAAAEPAPVEPAPVISTEVEVPRAAPLGSVETVTLGQLPPAAAPSPAPAQPPTSPTPAPASAPSRTSDATLSHVVGPGDTFFAIARRYGVGPQAVADVNGLTFASTLRLGQRVQLPVGARDRGPDAARPAGLTLAQAAPAAAPARATVVESEPPVVQPARAPVSPPLAAPAPVTPPPAAPTAVARPVTPPAIQAPVPVPPSASAMAATPSSPTPSPAPVQRPAAASTPPPVVAAPPPLVRPTPPLAAIPVNPALPGRGVFVWPLRGDILSGFGPKGVGQRSDGVNISAAEGDPVRAAAAGTVVYAGDQVKGGFGKLVLVEHEGRWFSAYAHLSEIGVRMKERVGQNQQIGRVGRTGSVSAPQLYFEVRHAPSAGERARPVDPLPLLPQ